MEYRSPLGSSFKLERSLLASEKTKIGSSPSQDESPAESLDSERFKDRNRHSREISDKCRFDYTPRLSKSNWRSPNARHSHSNSQDISVYYHPSMLENPWEGLE